MGFDSLLNDLVIVRGGGDIATGVVQKFFRAGFRVLILETARPTAIRRTVSLCAAVFDGVSTVEDMTARHIRALAERQNVWAAGEIPVYTDPDGHAIRECGPGCVIDAIIAKKNMGTNTGMAPVVIALGPGFRAPRDAHAVIETMRGHTLGRVIFEGEAMANTGVPGLIGGRAAERVLYAPHCGTLRGLRKIGDAVSEGEGIFSVDKTVVTAPFSGVLRGLIADGTPVTKGFKAADIDPRADSDCRTVTDKARCIGGGALEAYLYLRRIAQGAR